MLDLDQSGKYITNTHKVFMIIESNIHPDLKEKDLISRIFKAFPKEVAEKTVEQVQIKADFIIPLPKKFIFDRSVFFRYDNEQCYVLQICGC